MKWQQHHHHMLLLLLLLFPVLLFTPVSSEYQVSQGTLESGVGLGLGIFPSVINNLQQTESPPPPSSSSSGLTTGAYATLAIIRVHGNVATAIYGDGGSVTVRDGDTIRIAGNNVATNGLHVVSVVTSSTVFSFATNAAPGSYSGGILTRVNTNADCPAGYYCNGDAQYVCGGSIYYCPARVARRLSVFVGSDHQGAHYTTGGSGNMYREKQVVCPQGHYCEQGIMYKCPAGRYGSRYGEHDPRCEGDCAAGFYCPSGSYRADQFPCSVGVEMHIDPYCPTGSPTPIVAKEGYYTFGTVKINVLDRQDAEGWRANKHYNDAPREILANSRMTICEPGYFCINGIRKMCRPGFYGQDHGAAADTCTSQCPGGYYCPMGTVTPIKCGAPSHFCPVQSEAPRQVNNGYYSFSHFDNPSNDTHSDEHQCELGTYCVSGVRHRCPAGRYGVTWGLNTSHCSGLCAPGYYCPLQSHLSTQHECGGVHVYCPEGSPLPIEASPGYYTASTNVPSLRHDDLSIKLWQNWKELLFPTLRTTAQNLNRSRNFVVVEDSDPTHRTRYRHLICPTGNYCIRGRRHLCPAGTYGDVEGLHTLACAAPSPAGFFAPPGTSNSTQYPCSDPGFYCPSGSGSPTPVPQGWYSFAPHSWLRNTKSECHHGNANASNTEVCSIFMHSAMYYRLHNDAGYEMYRTTIRMCPPGFFCPGVSGDGHIWEMPPGRVGISSGISSYVGEGTVNCTAGFYCVAGSYSSTSRRCGSNVLVPLTHEIQVFSTNTAWTGTQRREVGVSGSFVVEFDTTVRSDQMGVQWNRLNSSTVHCESPCRRRMVNGRESPPRAVAHDATAEEMKYFLEMLPNIGTVNVSRQIISEQDHTYAWSVTFVTVLGDVPLLKVRIMTTAEVEINNANTPWIVDNVHSHQNDHDAVHHFLEPIRGATVNVMEHTAGAAKIRSAGSTSNVYCPTGSGNPTPVDSGYYTNLRNNIFSQVQHPTVKGDGLYEPSKGRSGENDEMAYEQVHCEVGHWCDHGLRDACPRGRYGKVRGLTTEFCSGPCAPGFICPHGSYSSSQLDCGNNVDEPTSVYCPPGLHTAAWDSTLVTPGYYTTGGDEKTNRSRWAQTICPLGHYCSFGKRIRCPSGKYGGVEGLSDLECSGNCAQGYFCPQGSWLATQNECGSDYGVRSPCKVKQRDGESMLEPRTGERRCEDDHGAGTRDYVHSQGTGHTSIHHQETEDYTMAQPRQYHYHTTLYHTSRERFSGDPSSVYCPSGTGIPMQVASGYYTEGGDGTTNRTRTTETKCPTGFFCEEGKKYQCPPGRYGNSRGLTTEFCSGFCPGGFTCPWNTSQPIQCVEGEYSQAGSMTCTPCPQRPGWSIRKSTCRTSRSCCFT